MIKNAFRYTTTVVNGEQILEDTGNNYVLVSQRPYKGKMDDAGKELIKPGVTVTLQITMDNSEPIKDNDGRVMENNVMETFDATIVGIDYPLTMKKGDHVKLNGFKSEISYYVNFALILRFSGIELINGKVKE